MQRTASDGALGYNAALPGKHLLTTNATRLLAGMQYLASGNSDAKK